MIKATNTCNVRTPHKENIPWYKLAEECFSCELEKFSEQVPLANWSLSNESAGWMRRDILQAGGMCLQKASGNELSDTRKAPWPRQPPRTKFQQSRPVKLQIALITLICSTFKKVTGYMGEGQRKPSEILKTQNAASNVKQFATNYNMETECIASYWT